jgi:hypothetical protein
MSQPPPGPSQPLGPPSKVVRVQPQAVEARSVSVPRQVPQKVVVTKPLRSETPTVVSRGAQPQPVGVPQPVSRSATPQALRSATPQGVRATPVPSQSPSPVSPITPSKPGVVPTPSPMRSMRTAASPIAQEQEELAMKRRLTYDLAQPIDARKVVVKGPGLKEACPNRSALFFIYARGPDGEPMPGVRVEDVRVIIRGGPTTVTPSFEDSGDGRIQCIFTPTVSGKYTIAVSMGTDAGFEHGDLSAVRREGRANLMLGFRLSFARPLY